ncbi:UNVERIFIED_CONTAM: hypothetical protein FKN15_058160 [Acipenser sinensis]
MAAPVTEEQFTALQLLLKAPSKEAVKQLCQDGFSWHGTGSVESTASSLSITAEEAQQLLGALHSLSHHVLFHGLSSEQLLAVFPDTFHPSLKNLLTKILLEHSFLASAGGYGLESGYQNSFRLCSQDGSAHLPSADEANAFSAGSYVLTGSSRSYAAGCWAGGLLSSNAIGRIACEV